MEKIISYNYSAGHSVKYRLLASSDSNRSVTIIQPAMGIRASYYKRLARCMVEELEVDVIISDYRGMGNSSVRANRSNKIGYSALVNDIIELIHQLKKEGKYDHFRLCGHSLGGQIASMCAARIPALIQEVILIGSCLPYYKGWTGPRKNWLRFAGKTFYPLSLIRGFFPGDFFGFAGREGIHTMKDWCHLVNHGTFHPHNDHFNYESGMKTYNGKVTAFSFSNDELAPATAVDNLLIKFKSCKSKKHHHLVDFDHFNWSKSPYHIVIRLS